MSVHLSPSKKSLFWIIAASVFIGFVTFINILDSGSYKLDTKSQKILEKVSYENRIGLYVQLKEFDSASQTLKARIWITPPEKYATYLNSSVQVIYDTRVDISAAKIEYNDDDNSGFWRANQYLRAIDLELDTDNYEIENRYNDKWFPFDRYSLTLMGTIDFRVKGSDTEEVSDDVWESLPVGVQNNTASLSGWSALFKMSTFENRTIESSFLAIKYLLGIQDH